jgi:hypothetical protein
MSTTTAVKTPEAQLFLQLIKEEPIKQIVRGMIRGFAVGYGLQSAWKLGIGVIFGRVFQKPELLLQYLGKDSISFGCFLGSFNALFRIVYYALSKLQKNPNRREGWKIFIAGTVAGTSMMLDRKDRWPDIGMYMFARACASVASRLYDKNVLNVQSSNNLIIVLIRNHLDTFLFCLSCCVIMSTFVYRPDFFPRGYYKLFQTIEGPDKHITGNWRRRFRRYYNTFFRTEEDRRLEAEKLQQRALEKAKEYMQPQQQQQPSTQQPPQ